MLKTFILALCVSAALATKLSRDLETCPEVDGELATLLPHETDCTKFYYCEFGTKVVFNCPAGLEFNVELRVCDWPHSAKCNSGVITKPPPPPTTTAKPSTSCPAVDGVNATLLPHESDCSKFYYCEFGKPVEFDCPAGLHFNPTLSVCDWPKDAGCDSSSGGGGGGGSVTTPKPTPPPSSKCPAVDGVNATLIPHETDCSKFYYCEFGKPVEFDCPAGLHFNPTLSVCDWPKDAGCEAGSGGGGGSVTTPKPTPPSSVECPAVDGEYATLLPHETDCTKFYYCEFGKPVEFDCPAGLHFNPTLSVCDWPKDAGCVAGSKPTDAPITTTPEEIETVPTTQPTTESIPDTTTYPTPTPTSSPSGKCPAVDGENATLIPHENDCSKFYYCVFGKPVEYDCPAGLHFNPTLSVCDWPKDAGCDSSSGGGGGGGSVTTPKPTPPPSSKCPAVDGVNATLIPHETDCTKFYYCEFGKPVEFDCPAGLHFNPTLSVCDWPKDAGCEAGSGGGGGSVTTTESTPESNSTSSKPPVSGECPAVDGEYATLLPHETDCTKFYYCEFGKPVEFDCPAGLHFNPTLSVCDWPRDAGCVPGSGTPTTSVPSSTTTGTNTTTEKTTTTEEVIPTEETTTTEEVGPTDEPTTTEEIYPTEGTTTTTEEVGPTEETTTTEEATSTESTTTTTDATTTTQKPIDECKNCDLSSKYWPVKGNCSAYYRCIYGRKIKMYCTPGLKFNPITRICDFAKLVKC